MGVVSAGLLPDGRHFVSRARDEAAQWRSIYKSPIPASSLADRMGGYVQAYTLYSSVRPFGVTAIIGGWDSEAELGVNGQVGSGPKVGAGGKKEDAKTGGPYLYMIEPSGLYWVSLEYMRVLLLVKLTQSRVITARRLGKADRQQKLNLRSSTLPMEKCHLNRG